MFNTSFDFRKITVSCMTLLISILFNTKANAQDILGDVNNDKQFDITDITALISKLNKGETTVLTVDDIDGDGVVGKSDVDALAKFIVTKGNYAFIAFSTDFECNNIEVSAQNSELLIGDKQSITLSGEDDSAVKPGTHLIAVDPKTLNDGLKVTFNKIYDMYSQTATIEGSVDLKASHIDYLSDYKYSSFVGSSGFMGEGTAESPYLIHSKADWQLLSSKLYNQTTEVYNAFEGKTYKVVADIDFGGAYLHPVGMSNYFVGTLDGGNHRLYNFSTEVYSQFSGLIGGVSKNAVIKNFNIEVNRVGIRDSGTMFVSPFIAYAYNTDTECVTIENCHVSSYQGKTLSLSDRYWNGFGCVIGYIIGNANISNCTNDLSVNISAVYTSSTYQCSLGGIVGISQDSNKLLRDRQIKIDRCRNTANLTLTGKQDISVGGIAGRFIDQDGNIEPLISNCVNSGNISAGKSGEESTWLDDAMAGGIVGWMDSDGGSNDPYIYNCLNTGKIYANQCDSWAAGICGYAYDSDTQIINCASSGSYTADDTDAICASGSSKSYCYSSNITSDQMNQNISKISSSSLPSFCNWVGSQAKGTLDIDLTSNK